jgi:ATP-dependent Clp endopeptidase proteolytic subunit ClpP
MNQEEEEQSLSDILFFGANNPADTSRVSGLYGEVTDDNCRTLISSLYYFRDTGKIQEEPEDQETDLETKTDPVVSYTPMDFLVSTEGGSVQDMFAVYDCMRDIKKDCDIRTFGIGKVMSAGVLLLAAGTKGSRRVGKSCRLMLHAPSGGQFGSLKELEVDIREVKWYQDQFVKALAQESNLSERKIRGIFRKKTDTYFDADQAVEWGIADEVV